MTRKHFESILSLLKIAISPISFCPFHKCNLESFFFQFVQFQFCSSGIQVVYRSYEGNYSRTACESSS